MGATKHDRADRRSQFTHFYSALVPRLSPTVFLLDNARVNTQDPSEKGRTFVIAPATEDLNISTHLDHEVTITGKAEDKVVPTPKPGEKVDEKDLPKLQASGLTMVADRCTGVK